MPDFQSKSDYVFMATPEGNIAIYRKDGSYIATTLNQVMANELCLHDRIVKSLHHYIEKVSVEIDKTIEGTAKGLDVLDLMKIDRQERLDFLSTLHNKLKFFVEHPDSEMIV